MGLNDCIGLLLLAYPNQEFPKSSQRFYKRMLADLDPGVLKLAIEQMIAERPYATIPTVGDIREKVHELEERTSGLPIPFDAWSEVMEQMRAVGSYGNPTWSHPVIGKTVAGIGGWRNLCMSENLTADRARFVQAYEMYAKRARDDRRMLPQVRKLVEKMGKPQLRESN